jgi:methylated-DNA-[protein]-cysteine S-methyltransferase
MTGNRPARAGAEPIAVGALDTQIGRLAVAVTRFGTLAVGWESPAALAERAGRPVIEAAQWTAPVLAELAGYFAGRLRRFTVPLDWSLTGGAQQLVLRTLYDTVGFGDSITYGGLAERSGTDIPARGIGSVMGGNPLPIVVPCHRVLAAGGLGGYSGGVRPPGSDAGAPDSGTGDTTVAAGGSSRYGLETKRWLLTFEEVLPPTLGWDPQASLADFSGAML